MRDIATAFYSKQKSLWRRVMPAFECRCFRHAIETVVDLNSIKMADVEGQHVFFGKILRIERSAPVFVMPSGCSDMHLAGHLEYAISWRNLTLIVFSPLC